VNTLLIFVLEELDSDTLRYTSILRTRTGFDAPNVQEPKADFSMFARFY